MGGDRVKKTLCSKHGRKYHRRNRKAASSDDETDVTYYTTTTTTCEKCFGTPRNECTCYDSESDGHRDFEKVTPSSSLRKRVVAILSPSVSSKTLTNILSTDTSEVVPPTKLKPNKLFKRNNKVRKSCSKRNNPSVDRKSRMKVRKPRKSECSRNHRRASKPPIPQQDLPKCELCSKVFDSPILLCCGHTFCKRCVTVFVEASDGTSFRCPICETDIKLSGDEEELFCPNFVILKQLEQDNYESEDDILCAVCTSDTIAEFYCESCRDILCDECASAHRVVKYTKNHRVREIDSTTDVSSLVRKRYYCLEHENFLLDTFCSTCEKSICQKCVLQRHRSNIHTCLPIKMAVQKVKDDMRRQLYDFNGRAPNLQLALMDLKHAKKTLREQANATYAEINESITRMMTLLKEHEKKLYKKLEDVCQTKAAALKAQKNRTMLHLEKFQTLGNILKELDNHDNDIETLQMRATIHACADSLEDFTVKLHTMQSSVLFNSNETRFKKELSKHGKIFHYTSNEPKITKEDTPSLNKSIENYYIVSNFTDHVSLPLTPESSALSDIFLRKNAKSIRAKSNWMIVKSRLPDIIRCNWSRRTQRSPTKISTRKLEMSRARKQKAKANWMILRSHLRDVREQSRSEVIPYRKSIIPNLESTRSRKKRKIKAMRSRAIRQRAEANWLLVRSKLSEIVDFGRVTGRLFSPIKPKTYRKRPSPTILKLKHYRAVTLRARANWLLVASRLPDIAKYPKKVKTTRKEKVTWDTYLSELAFSRRKATRNKYVAGVLRARANWMIVRSRILDIVLYGKYQRYSGRQHSPPQSRSNSPVKEYLKRTPSKQSLRGSRTSLNRSPSKPQRPFDGEDGLISSRSKNRQPKDVKAEKSQKKKPSKIPVRSPRPVKSKTELAVENWRKLIQNTHRLKKSSPVKSKSQTSLKHFDNLVKGTSTKPSPDALNHWDHLIQNTTANVNDVFVNWDKLIQSTPKKSVDRNMENVSLSNWDILTKNTHVKRTSSFKSKTAPYRNWDILIQNTTKDSKKRPSLRSQDAFRNWDNLVRTKSIDTQKSLHDWDHLIVGTSTLSPSRRAKSEESLSRYSESEEHWYRLFDKAKKEKKNGEDNWHRLTKDSHFDKRYAEQHWDNLVHFTPMEKTKPGQRAKKKWDKIRTSLGKISNFDQIDSSQSMLSSKQTERAYQNWWLLTSGVKNGWRSSKMYHDDDVREKAVRKRDELLSGTQASSRQNWNTLVQGKNATNNTGTNKEALENWTRLIAGAGTENTEEKGPTGEAKNVNRSEAEMANWHNLSAEERKALQNHWHNLIYATKAAPPYDTMAALNHWEKLIEGRIIRRKASKISSLSATGRSVVNTQNYPADSRGESLFKRMSDAPPPGFKLLYDKSRSSTPGYQGPKVMRLNIKDNSGSFSDVGIKLSSENQSLLSAHLKENTDGTFTIFCCPTIDGTFNIVVSLKGSDFQNEIDVLNLKGNFAKFTTEKDMTLACRTISLIRWQLTPGLLARQGERIVAFK